MKKKAYLQVSFTWLFAIIVGAVILFLAIYFSAKIINTGQEEVSLKTGKNFVVLTNPLEIGFEKSKSNDITFPVETRLYTGCDANGEFGRQLTQISQKSFNTWTKPEGNISSINKYYFSERYVEGRKVYLFSKPFDFPFKVSDVIYITSSEKNYCFVQPPENVAKEISAINQSNFFLKNYPENCIKVCFEEGSGCNISVDYNSKIVTKDKETMHFEGDALMYGAIFSSPENYECQVKRLMKRTKNLALLYESKAEYVSTKGCNTNLNLIGLAGTIDGFQNSLDLGEVNTIANEISENNYWANCHLW